MAMQKQRGKITDLVFLTVTALTAFSIIAISLGIFIVLFKESLPAMNKFGFEGFIFSTEWNPVKEIFSAGPALVGTLITSLLSLTLAVNIVFDLIVFITAFAPYFLCDLLRLRLRYFLLFQVLSLDCGDFFL